MTEHWDFASISSLTDIAQPEWSFDDLFSDDHHVPDAPKRGYSLRTSGLRGAALLTPRNYGMNLVYRLKDTEPQLKDEIGFWASQLALLLPDDIDLITHAPPSEKPDKQFHLATALAGHVGVVVGKPVRSLFKNLNPRGHRATLQEKLRESKRYRYDGPNDGSHIAIIDDVVQTGTTGRACVMTAIYDDCQLFALCTTGGG